MKKATSFSTEAYVDQHISCYGNHDGYIQVNVTPKDDSYTFFLKNSRKIIKNDTGTFLHLAPGIYYTWVENVTGEVSEKTKLRVTTPKALNMKFEVFKKATKDVPFGDVQVNITGGTAELQPFLVSWIKDDVVINTEDNNFATQMYNLPVGKYSVTIEDDRGCFKTSLFTLKIKK